MKEEFDESVVIDTYKSKWLHSKLTGNYKRLQKEKYPLEWLASVIKPLTFIVPKMKGLVSLLGRKPQGVDFYKHYTDEIDLGKFGTKWEGEFKDISERLANKNTCLDNKEILDISGEPGFFASDAKSIAKRIIVTAFADEVAKAMKEKLGLEAYKYDYQEDTLLSIFHRQIFDIIFVRYSIGFCVDLANFIKDCKSVLKKDGLIYISFSPASRAVCARWMFDDYTYLRQYTREYLKNTAHNLGLYSVGEWDDGSYQWDKDKHPVQKIISRYYIDSIFKNCIEHEFKQHNIALLFQNVDESQGQLS